MKYPINSPCINSIGNGLIIDYDLEEIVINLRMGWENRRKYVKLAGLANVSSYLEFQKI